MREFRLARPAFRQNIYRIQGIHESRTDFKRAQQSGGQGLFTRRHVFIRTLFFLAAGLFAFWLIVINPLMRWNRAKSWSQADCKILSSKIQKRRDDDGIRYKAKIEYQYQVGRTKHQGDSDRLHGFFRFAKSGAKNSLNGGPPGRSPSVILTRITMRMPY